MDKQLSNITNFIKKNPITMAAIGLAIIATISVVAYSQSQKSALQRSQLDADAKLASQIEDSKNENDKRIAAKKAAEKKSAEEAAAKKAAEEKAAAEAAAKKAAEEAAAAAQAAATSISLSSGTLIAYEGKTKIPVSWNAGFVSEKGYKLVWNTSGSPTYPGSDYQYFSEASSSGSGYVKAFSPGTYYIRVCEYLGGECGRYSNQIVVTVP